MALAERQDGGPEDARGSGPPESSSPGRTVAIARWALVVAAAALAIFSVARAGGWFEPPAAAGDLYVCPMHPDVTSGEPGLCPVCKMRLEPRSRPAAARVMPAARTAPVRRKPLSREVRAPATIAVPDGRLVSVSARVQGWIADLRVAEVGRRVERGQVLATIDSPDLYRTQQKFLNAVRWSRSGAPNLQPSHDGDSTGDLVAEARLQLRQAGLADGDIASIGAAGRPERAVAVRAPASGVVIRVQAGRGGFVAVGQELFAIADLRTVWAVAEVPEGEVSRLRVGERARVEPPAGSSIDGEIVFIHPTVVEGSRTVSVRVELPNRDGALRPGMSAVVRLAGAPALVPVVPATAVVDTGRGRIVFVAREGIEVVSGLGEGELVVSEGAFLLEAESRLRAARPAP